LRTATFASVCDGLTFNVSGTTHEILVTAFDKEHSVAEFPRSITEINHVAPAPRRIRGSVGREILFDSTRALYVWEWPHYPQYYVPREDVRMDFLGTQGDPIVTPQGEAQIYALSTPAIRAAAARMILTSPIQGLRETVRFTWDALDQWFEEDEEIFVHPRSPYTRVDALRSRRRVRVEIDGVVLAESTSPVMLFETGLPTRYYIDQSDVAFNHLIPSPTRTACPYKGRTTGYWSVSVNAKTHVDLAWMYSFPTRQVLPIAGLVAFLNEKADIFIDGVGQPRPRTHMGK
jgi:uncharacterized protein (DUF427 family)